MAAPTAGMAHGPLGCLPRYQRGLPTRCPSLRCYITYIIGTVVPSESGQRTGRRVYNAGLWGRRRRERRCHVYHHARSSSLTGRQGPPSGGALHLAGAFVAAAAIVSSAWSPVLSQDVESTPDMEAIVSEVDAAVAEAQSLLDSGRYDALRPERIVADVGDEPTALRDWVGEHTRWVPYLGTLRGAEGVLIDGTGSSLDRSLLLAELLAQAGRPARLARARLSDEVARGIIENEAGRWRAAPRVSPADLSPAELEHRQAIADAAADVSGWVPLTAEGAPTMTTSASEAARDHWWVQSQDGTTWLDLDPLLADTTRPEAEETYAPDFLPRELSHLVTIRVVAERWDRDGLETFMPFEHQYVFGGTPAFETARLSVLAWRSTRPGARRHACPGGRGDDPLAPRSRGPR